MFVKALRVGLGQLIIFIDFITRPSKKKRPAAAQAQVESAAKGLTLYQFHACPFCVKTRRTLRRLNVPVALRDPRLSRAGNWLARHLTQALEALVRIENWLRTPIEREPRDGDREILESLLARLGDQAGAVAEQVLGPAFVRAGGCDG